MHLYIAGGCMEHGRNCFLLHGESFSVLIDCGIMSGDVQPYPQLSKEQIKRIKYLFLTHSHLDHAGALEWLYKMGFNGQVYLSKHTYSQMAYKPVKFYFIEQISQPLKEISVEDVFQFQWGRSGHCVGAVWFAMKMNGKKVLFSGDYCESSIVYKCDFLRNFQSDLAVIDCAYGTDNSIADDNTKILTDLILNKVQNKEAILIPVPKNGRGLDILKLLSEFKEKNFCISLDTELNNQCKNLADYKEWFCNYEELQNKFNLLKIQKDFTMKNTAVFLVADPQLNKSKNKQLADIVISEGGSVIQTGSVDSGSYAEVLKTSKKSKLCRYFVHQNLLDSKQLISKNAFNKVVLSHCEESFEINILSKECIDIRNVNIIKL